MSTTIMQSLTFILFMVPEKIATIIFTTYGQSASWPAGLTLIITDAHFSCESKGFISVENKMDLEKNLGGCPSPLTRICDQKNLSFHTQHTALPRVCRWTFSDLPLDCNGLHAGHFNTDASSFNISTLFPEKSIICIAAFGERGRGEEREREREREKHNSMTGRFSTMQGFHSAPIQNVDVSKLPLTH